MAIVRERNRIVLSNEDARIFNKNIGNNFCIENKNTKEFMIQVKEKIMIDDRRYNVIKLR